MSRSLETQKLINEKTVQRYIFEELNYGNKDTLKKFYPNSVLQILGSKQIKVIIPNYPLEFTKVENGINKIKEHKTDFRIIYDDYTYHNVEVEWVTSSFESHGKEVYEQIYKDGKGFLMVLEDDSISNDKIDYIDTNDIKQIDAEKFAYWYVLKSKYIVDETISNYVPHYLSRTSKPWLIYLAGTDKNKNNSLYDYFQEGRRKGKWAFNYTNKGKHMKNIIDICKGDTVIFIWGLKTLNGTHQRQISIDNDWYVSGIEIAKIKKGYYCDFNDETFESEEWKLNKEVKYKEYMHYFKFDKNYLYSSEDNKNLISTEKFLYKDMDRL